MKAKIISFTLILAVLFLSSCDHEAIKVSNEISTKSISVLDYTALEVANDFNVYITFSDIEEEVKIEANDNLQEYIVTNITDNKLRIKLKNNLIIKGKETLNIYIKTKNINDFSAYGDVKIELENTLETTAAKIKLFGDSYFSGEIIANKLDLELKGDSKTDIYGSIKNLSAKLTGDSNLDDYDLAVENINIELFGDSQAHLTVTNTINIEAAGDSSFFYKGNATIVSKQITGDSKMVKRD